MAKRTRINGSEMEIPLPISAIHHIQSFLGGKQAARTSLVSKSWYKAWLTRPDLYFNERCFDGNPRLLFRDFVKATLKRYEESNLNINSFKLLRVRYVYKDEEISEFIKKGLKLCVNGADLKLKFGSVEVPWELLDSKTVVRLSLYVVNVGQFESGKATYSRLKSLSLERCHIKAGLFKDTFPCLADLTLFRCDVKELEISSTSLKCITIVNDENLGAKLSVSNIRKFVFHGLRAPSLSLMEASMEWEFDISLKYLSQERNKSWFIKLKNFLRRLSLLACKVSLSIGFYGYSDILYYPLKFPSRIIPKLENLTLTFPSPIFEFDGALIDTLLGICRPKFITQNLFPDAWIEEKANKKLLRLLCKRSMQDLGNIGHKSTYNHLLEAVHVEVFDKTHDKWQPLDCQTFLNGSEGLECKRYVRFKLKWRD